MIRTILALQEVTVRKILTPNNIIYIIPESIHLKEWRLEDNNTLLFFPPTPLEWTRSILSQNPPLMHSEDAGLARKSLRCSKAKDVGELL
jgi:hypothetical protein